MRSDQSYVIDHNLEPCVLRVAWAEIATLVDCPEADRVRSYLSRSEVATYQKLRAPARRRTWLAGRILAKRLFFRACQDVEGQSWRADQIAIRSGVDQRNSQRPEIFLPNQQSVNWNLSISHSGSVVYAAIIPQLGLQIGVDVVDRQPLGHGFLPSWFTTRECEVIGEEDETALQCRAWAIKEAAYKAANRGEGFSPRTLKIESKFQNGGFRCSYRPVNSTSRDIRWTQAICITDERWEAAVAICSDQNRRGAIVFDLIVNDLATVFTNPPSNSMDAEGIVFRNYSLCSYSCHQEQHICAGYSSANQSSSILREFVS